VMNQATYGRAIATIQGSAYQPPVVISPEWYY